MSLEKESFSTLPCPCLSLSLTSLLSRPVFIQESFSVEHEQQQLCQCAEGSFLAARRAWPGRGRDDQLPAPVRRVYDSWMSVSEDDRLIALEAAVGEGFARRPGRDSPRAQCQDLTLSGSPLLVAHSDVRLLTAE